MIENVKEHIKKYNLLSKGDKIVVAVSGGPDSVVLLHVLKSLQEAYDLTISVCHLNHQLRGKDADDDADFVEALAKSYHLKAYIFSQDVAMYSSQNKMSFEEGAREVRYKLFNKVLKETNSHKLAVGQNKNDQAETFFIRLFRGAGLEGLTGIKFKREHIIRPLLSVARFEIENYIKVHDLTFRTDLTNNETIYTRNKIRHEVLPYIKKEFNENIVDQIYTTSILLQNDLDFIESEVEKQYKQLKLKDNHFSIKLTFLQALHPSILSRLIRKMILELMNNLKGVSYNHIQSILLMIAENKHGNSYRIKEKICFEINYDMLWIYPLKISKGLEKTPFILNETFEYGNQTLSVLDLPVSTREKNTITIDADRIKGKLYIRTRLPGDRISPLGMKGSKKLSDFLIDLKVPAFKRDDILLLCDDQEIIWVVGHRMSEHYKINSDTLLRLTIKHNK